MVAVAWILLSDAAIHHWLSASGKSWPVQTVKGLVFVAVTSGLVYVLVRRLQRREASEQEQAARDRWLRSLGHLTLEVAHQIKNPLFGITAVLDAIEERSGDDPATVAHRRILRQQASRIEHLVSGLQVYGRRLDLDPRPTDLAETLETAVAGKRALAEEVGVDLEFVAEERPLVGRVDGVAVVGAVDRVVRNAVEHSPAGAVVTVRLGRVPGEAGVAEIAVLDRGPGFPAGSLDHVFEPLFARRAGGAGLGLAIASRLVEAHGGRVAAANRPDGGARVVLRLPL